MMKATKNRNGGDFSDYLATCEGRRILGQCEMSTKIVVIDGVGLQHAAQVCLAKHNEVIETLASNRADRSFDVAVLPRRARRDRVIANAHGTVTPSVPTDRGTSP